MSGTTFLNLRRGGRLQGFAGLRMDEGKAWRFANDYSYVELGCDRAVNGSGEESMLAVRNQFLQLHVPCSLQAKESYKCLVVVNPELMQFASVPSMLLFDSPRAERVVIPAKFHRDLDMSTLEWLVRIYLIS